MLALSEVVVEGQIYWIDLKNVTVNDYETHSDHVTFGSHGIVTVTENMIVTLNENILVSWNDFDLYCCLCLYNCYHDFSNDLDLNNKTISLIYCNFYIENILIQ